jgi:Ca2+-binding RTX toxin-like protein
MAITASFVPGTGVLTATGDGLDNAITASRDAAGNILVNGGAVPIVGGTATVANTTLIQAFGQDGNDTIALDETNGALPNAALFGGNGADTLIGGSGNDVVVGGTGNDLALLGAGNDTFFWNPGDGSDTVEGQAGIDRLDFAGANINENIDISANGGRVRLTRDVGSVTMDVNGVERIDVHALGGADTVVINDLTGTDLPLAGVAVDLEGALGTGVGDGQVDTVIVNGTAGNDPINLVSINGGAGVLITGGPAPVAIFHSEATDQLVINGGAGGDIIDASGLNAGQIGLTLNGGLGGDVLIGSQGNDVLNGGDGNEVALLGAGNDVFVWNPGDDNDTVEGQAGFDRLDFNGANINEIIDISANGERVRFTRDIATVTMDLNDVEQVDFHALGGADTIVVNDLTGTDLSLAGVKIDLEGVRGSGVADGALDSVTVIGGAGSETINVTAFNGGVLVSGTPAAVGVFHADATDQLIVNGGAGNDTINASTLAAGAIALTLDGSAGDDTLTGSQGTDVLRGGDGNDTLTGGPGGDQVFGDDGNDRLIWNPGDGTDLFEGGDGSDTAEVNGGNGAEVFTVTANGTRVRFDRLDPAPFSLDIGTTENLVLNMNGGDDTFSATGNLAALISLRVDGGAGNDTILGGNGVDTLLGGDGNDFIDGNQGNDVALLGAGDDVFQWDPGDGSDTVEGQAGFDRLDFNGANLAEIFDISANGERVRFVRNIGTVTMDLNDVEQVDVHALAGADTITVNDLTGTDLPLAGVKIDLEGARGSGVADGALDSVTVNGGAGSETINVAPFSGGVLVSGTPAAVGVFHADATDQLIVNGGAGNDTINASTLAAGAISLTLNGGTGNDVLTGSQGNDSLLGDDGNDLVVGGRGDDLALLGAGNDTFFWNPGDGSDTVEGQAGIDRLDFVATNLNEIFDISANGGRVRLSRDVGSVTMDVNGVERIDVHALGGADTIVINDLTGTDLPLAGVAVDLEGALGAGVGDGQVDQVIVNGTAGDDAINLLSIGAGSVLITGSPAPVAIFHADAGDQLTINGGAGNDTINASGLNAGQIGLTLNLGLGGDVFFGSQGNDVVIGGDGNDAGFLGAGNDVFIWNPGDDNDVVEGGSGTDTLLFNGANVSESITISANGDRLNFSRDVANVTMDVNDTEVVDFHAFGGADTITVNDLSGTDVNNVRIDLSAAGGGGDGQVDTIVINATNGDDVITVSNNNGVVTVSGLAAQVTISGFEATDRIVINGVAGDDVIDASGLGTAMLFTADGGDGNDVLIGSDGPDTLLGGAGDDVLLGGLGLDVLDGGPGDNVLVQDIQGISPPSDHLIHI